ncbi:hypothetical protein WICPIJ_007868 [Wickerhamomyces pijperi]|uniref:Uncharacterized protein n=1 Tax=Wickerhamomyces pijperi TaxID=599730 RepID=A0A9P8PZE8_WICPI|nr:hypothetical protein WICPIJ_007868 [Wickerhamomyces pijperi]
MFLSREVIHSIERPLDLRSFGSSTSADNSSDAPSLEETIGTFGASFLSASRAETSSRTTSSFTSLSWEDSNSGTLVSSDLTSRSTLGSTAVCGSCFGSLASGTSSCCASDCILSSFLDSPWSGLVAISGFTDTGSGCIVAFSSVTLSSFKSSTISLLSVEASRLSLALLSVSFASLTSLKIGGLTSLS